MANIEFKTGDIILFEALHLTGNPKTWFSYLIGKITGSRFSHAGIVVKNWDVSFVNESDISGVVNEAAIKRLASKRKYVIKRPVFTIIEKDKAVKANSELGIVKYNYQGLLWQIIYLISGHWYGYSNAKRADNKMYCSEYVAWIYNEQFPEWYKTTPEDIYNNENFITVNGISN